MNKERLVIPFIAIILLLMLAGCATPNISLTISANKTSFTQAGETINYTYTIRNSGTAYLHAVTLSNTHLAVHCPADMSTLMTSQSFICTGTYLTTAADVQAGVVVDAATASAYGTEKGCCGSNSETVSSSARSEIPLEGEIPTLSLTKTFAPGMFKQIGEVITYSYVLLNDGVTSLTGPCSVVDNLNLVACPSRNTMLPNAHITCVGQYIITLADIQSGSISNTATAHCSNVTSNTVSAQIVIDRQPVLSLIKSPSQNTYSGIGEQINYTYTVQNIGGLAIQGPFVLTDDKLTVQCPSISNLDVGQSYTCSTSYTTVYADLLAGVIRNTATVSNASVSSNTALSEVRIDPQPALLLTKTADRSTYSHAGEMIHYTYSVKNTGNVPISGPFFLIDSNVDQWQCLDPATLNPGQSFTCTSTYSARAGDVGKTITNSAGIIVAFNNKAVNSNTAQASVEYKPAEEQIICTIEMGQDPSNADCYCGNFSSPYPSWCLD